MKIKISNLSGQYLCRLRLNRLADQRFNLYTKKCSILIIVLWSLFLLSMFALAINAYIGPQLKLASRLKGKVNAYYLAKAGVKKAISLVLHDEMPRYDALKKSWNNDEKEFKEISLDDGIFSVSSSSNIETQAKYGLIDEERKININKSSYDVLKRFFQIVGGLTVQDSASLSDCVIDWRDEDNNVRQSGAENSYYMSLSEPYPCKNKDFEVIEELLLVKGMNREIFNKIKDRITVYTKGAVNINTADPLVLESLGISDVLTQKIVSFRNGNDAVEATDDDNVFTSVSTIVSDLQKVVNLSQEEINQLNNIINSGLVCVGSENFSATSTGWTKNRYNFIRVMFVFNRSGEIKYWKEE